MADENIVFLYSSDDEEEEDDSEGESMEEPSLRFKILFSDVFNVGSMVYSTVAIPYA